MTEQEFDVLDELYFLQPFSYLKEVLDMSEDALGRILEGLVEKGWVRVYENADDEADLSAIDLSRSAEKFLYLASKEGLLAHNGR